LKNCFAVDEKAPLRNFIFSIAVFSSINMADSQGNGNAVTPLSNLISEYFIYFGTWHTKINIIIIATGFQRCGIKLFWITLNLKTAQIVDKC
jgi:hypothetical protein